MNISHLNRIIKEAKQSIKQNPDEQEQTYQEILKERLKTLETYKKDNRNITTITDFTILSIARELESC